MDIGLQMKLAQPRPTWAQTPDGGWTLKNNHPSIFQQTIIALNAEEAKLFALAVMHDQKKPLSHDAIAAMEGG
jgi:hypothetical protein